MYPALADLKPEVAQAVEKLVAPSGRTIAEIKKHKALLDDSGNLRVLPVPGDRIFSVAEDDPAVPTSVKGKE